VRSAQIVYKQEPAGILTQKDDGTFLFSYSSEWIQKEEKPPVSLTLPKSANPFQSPYLFAFFYNMLPEGINKNVICKQHRIDPDDHFGLLLVSAKFDTIGAVQVVEIPE
jgi:serine/threonine-protein kinase HipA